MWLYNLGETTWNTTQAIVCALASLRREGAVVSHSESPCLCAGGQVNLDRQVDLVFCREHAIPVYRRETRGKSICLARRQLELQLVLPRGHRWVAEYAADRGRLVLWPLLETCRELGLDAALKSPFEIVVGGRRIATACAGEVHQHFVLAASLTLEFDPDLFALALQAPSRELRARVAEMARACRTSLAGELDLLPEIKILEAMVCKHWERVIGELRPAEMDAALDAQMRDDAAALFAPSRETRDEGRTRGWVVEMGAGSALHQCTYKAPGGFLRAICEWRDGRIVHASLSGDFFCYPPGGLFQLEQALVGARADQVAPRIAEMYGKLGLVTPGIHASHWEKVLSINGNNH